VKPASYDVSLETYDASLTLKSTVQLADSVEGEPVCKQPNNDVRRKGAFDDLDANQWQIGDSSGDGSWVGVAYSPKTGTTRLLLASPDSGSVKTLDVKPDQVVGNSVHYQCGDPSNSMDYRICSGSFAQPKVALLYQEKQFVATTNAPGYCDTSDANCNYVPFHAQSGVTALNAPGMNGDGTVAIVDPLTGKSRWKTSGLDQITSAATDPGSGAVAVGGPAAGQSGKSLVMVFDASGKKLWQAPADAVCGATKDGFVVTANSQIALLRADTGEQLASSSDVTSCPQVSEAGLGFWSNGSAGPTLVSLKP
jgi:hypothetical protein